MQFLRTKKNLQRFFSKNFFLSNQQQKIIFLEGETISNKTTNILEKLNKMGFVTYDNELPIIDSTKNDIKEFTEKIKKQLNFEKEKKNQKENIIFFNGSPLSLLLINPIFEIYEKSLIKEMKELKKEFQIINLHCLTEDYMMKMRLGYHFEFVLKKEFKIEMIDFLHELNEKYQNIFDDQLFTTDAKQAVYLLMQKYKIPFFEFPKDKIKR